MDSDLSTGGSMDRRVRRSRAALMRAAIELVGERGSANLSVSEIAAAADVSRPVLYQQFGDRDSLLLAAALDLAERELVPLAADTSGALDERERILAGTRHFADHRSFYRAMLTGPSGYALNRALSELLVPFNEPLARRAFGAGRNTGLARDLAAFITGGAAAVFNDWVVEGEDPLDPEEFTDRLMRMLTAVIGNKEERR